MTKKQKEKIKKMTEEEKKKYDAAKKKSRIIGWTVGGVLIAVFLLNVIILPLTSKYARAEGADNGENKYICHDSQIMLSAHRAGGELAPEETMMAFELCMDAEDYRVDIVEFDLHLTADEKLVLLHDDTADRTSNSAEVFGKDVKVREKTLAELKELNFGENFVIDGKYPYRGLRGGDIPDNVRILSLEELLGYLTAKRAELNYIIEIKDGGKDGERALDILYETLERYGITEQTIIGTFQNNVTKYIDKNYPDITRSASIMEVLEFYYSFLYGVKKDFDFEVLQIPVGLNGFFELSTAAFIDYAHACNIAVQYWTINDEETVRLLTENGADAIMTDNPEIAYPIMY